jgi:hypothetical protein
MKRRGIHTGFWWESQKERCLYKKVEGRRLILRNRMA